MSVQGFTLPVVRDPVWREERTDHGNVRHLKPAVAAVLQDQVLAREHARGSKSNSGGGSTGQPATADQPQPGDKEATVATATMDERKQQHDEEARQVQAHQRLKVAAGQVQVGDQVRHDGELRTVEARQESKSGNTVTLVYAGGSMSPRTKTELSVLRPQVAPRPTAAKQPGETTTKDVPAPGESKDAPADDPAPEPTPEPGKVKSGTAKAAAKRKVADHAAEHGTGRSRAGAGKPATAAKPAAATAELPTSKAAAMALLVEYVREHGTDDEKAPTKGLPFVHEGKVGLSTKHVAATLNTTRHGAAELLRTAGFAQRQVPFKIGRKKTAPSLFWHELPNRGALKDAAPAERQVQA